MVSRYAASLVLGGGGVTGIAWLTGVMAGLVRSGLVTSADHCFIGTSAGSVVATELACGVSAETLLSRQLASPASRRERFRPYSQREADAKNVTLFEKVNGDLIQARLRIGAFALRSETPSLNGRRAIVQSRLTQTDWPAAPLALTAVDVTTAARVILNSDSGLTLVDAVMASCAVPGVWPVVPFGRSGLMDGGLHSMTNADLAMGSERVLVLAPLGYSEGNPVSGHLRSEEAALLDAGIDVCVVVPDRVSREAIGDNVLDPARGPQSAEAGLKQGLELGQRLGPAWIDPSRAAAVF